MIQQFAVDRLGGQFGDGTIFRLTSPAQGSKKWTEDILHSFTASENNTPTGGVLIGASGELYGTTAIVQVNHPGRQSLVGLSSRVAAPSAIPIAYPGAGKEPNPAYDTRRALLSALAQQRHQYPTPPARVTKGTR